MPISMSTLIKDALLDLGVVRANETVSAVLGTFMLGRFNRIIDDWNVSGQAVYAVVFTQFTLVPALQPHTIGPSGATWELARPETIASVALILPGSIFVGVNERNAQWWAELSVPDLQTSIPTDWFYNPTYPSGSLYFWPVPTTAYDIELQTRTVLSAVAITDLFSLPPGYQSALTLTLEEDTAAALGVPMPETLPLRAAKARARIYAANSTPPPLRTQDAGMPGGEQGSNFNYHSRSWS